MSSAMLKGSRHGAKIPKSGLQTYDGADSNFNLLFDVAPVRESWKFIVRVVRLWEVSVFLHPEQVNSVEMVLVDEKVGIFFLICSDFSFRCCLLSVFLWFSVLLFFKDVKIHVTVRKELLYLFQKKLVEGGVYKLSYFLVSLSCGSYRTTPHAYKLFLSYENEG